jgi:serine/threonine protein kinase
MGVVLEAEDPALGRRVAIKILNERLATNPRAKERFLREARAAAAIRHDNVVGIYQVNEHDGTPYIVMPLLQGESLEQRLRRGFLSPDEVIRVGREIAEGLAAAHAIGLVHRDVKPANVWLEAPNGRVKLLDFGLARLDSGVDGLTETAVLVGTPHYMAPEQAEGLPVDHRADLFSLGAVLYELLTGHKAFSGPKLLSVLHALATHHPPPPREVVPSVPAALSELTMRLLEKSPGMRPASAAGVSAELREIGRALGDDAGASLLPSRPRRLGWAWVTVAVLVLGTGALIGWIVTRDRSVEPPPEPGATTPPPASQPLQVVSIEVNRFESTPAGDEPRGVLGQKTFIAMLGDRVQVTARLSRPAHAYLIAFRPDGVADLCFPNDEDTPPPPTDTPRYPPAGGLRVYGLREGTGLWVFAVVASEKPLPAYREWREQHAGATSAWAPVPQPPEAVVWWDDGESTVDALTAGGVVHALRGKDEQLAGPAAAIKRLTDALRTAGGTGTASAVGFGVLRRD